MTKGDTPPSAAAVAVRLRRFWLGEAMRATVVRKSDLGDVWREVLVRRVAATLELYTPYDFGTGDPLAGRLGSFLTTRVKKLSAGTVREVAWRYDDRVTPPTRRAKSTELDIHLPGDPALEEYDDVLARLRAGIPAGASDEAREVLGRLSLVGVSRHRLWLAAPDAAAELAVRKTSGAAFALHSAVQRVQKADPLYRVVVDPSYVDVPRL
jgi:hypothetical protein